MPAMSSIVVTGTWYLPEGSYQIEVAADLESAHPTVLLTKDPEIYTMAAVAEGYPIRFDAAWHQARRPNGKRCQVLDSLTLAGTTSHAPIHEDERTATQ